MAEKRVAETFGVAELCRVFPDEEACWRWLEDVRWQGMPVCPNCGTTDDIGRPPPASRIITGASHAASISRPPRAR